MKPNQLFEPNLGEESFSPQNSDDSPTNRDQDPLRSLDYAKPPSGSGRDSGAMNQMAEVNKLLEVSGGSPLELGVLKAYAGLNKSRFVLDALLSRAKDGEDPEMAMRNMLDFEHRTAQVQKLAQERPDLFDPNAGLRNSLLGPSQGSAAQLAGQSQPPPPDFGGPARGPQPNGTETRPAQYPNAFDPMAEAERLRQQREQAERDRLMQQQSHPDRSPLDQRWNAYRDELMKAPEAAPIIEKAHIGDPEAIIGLATVLLGGLGIAPHVLQGLSMGAQRVADETNANNRIEYQNRVNARESKLKAMEFDARKAEQDWQIADQQSREEFERQDRERLANIAGINGNIEHSQAIQLALEQALNDANLKHHTVGEWNATGDQWLRDKAYEIAKNYEANGTSEADRQKQADRIYAYLRPHADNRVFELGRVEKEKADAEKKAADSRPNYVKTFQFMPKWSDDFRTLPEAKKRKEFDGKFYPMLAEFQDSVHRTLQQDEIEYYHAIEWEKANGKLPTVSKAGSGTNAKGK